MGSLVAFPFWTEHHDVVINNVRIAAGHPDVDEVLCVGRERESTFQALLDASPYLENQTGTRVTLVVQERIGTSHRPGKGDGMNTGFRHFLESDHERLHFYDADITSFDPRWITKAERGADLGYGMVRDYFPRSSTDGMITWMVTRPAFATLFPRTELPWIDQPLGGEFLVTRAAAQTISTDPRVREQSDWGIDTLITFSAIRHGLSMLEVYIPQGKVHKLYGQLTDIRLMLIECFSAVHSLSGQDLSSNATHHIEPSQTAPPEIREKVGYDVDGTMRLLRTEWSPGQLDVLARFSDTIADGMRNAHRGGTSFLNEIVWHDALTTLLSHYQPGDADWEEILFQLWIARVLAYTSDVAQSGYDDAIQYLRDVIFRYVYRSTTGHWDDG